MIKFEPRPQARGVLDPAGLRERMTLSVSRPSQDLEWLVEHYWLVEWRLGKGESYRQYTVPHPSVHLVVVPGMCGIFGVMNRLFSYLLSGEGRVFGIKFAPGGFRALIEGPVSRLTDGRFPIDSLFGEPGRAYEEEILSCRGGGEELRDIAEEFLRSRGPLPDDNYRLIGEVVERVAKDRSIVKVEQLLDELGSSKRTLQRIFREYVGVGPKWVISRYRILEAAERLGAGEKIGLADLAQELGYFDQAHFIRDFKGLIGRAPAEYARGVARPSNDFR